MKPEIKAAWLQALRSGKYEQGQEYLFKDGAYCCLGVLCATQGAKFGVTEVVLYEEDEKDCTAFLSPELFTTEEELGQALRYHFGLTDMAESTLISMNDRDKEDFLVIADWIEKNV